ncbi:MAG: hypothetical protein OJF49_001157 [Ktedonobacterales bacterium]|jgi:predicted nucleotidyltransferase|nr:MAG: hypothetical protein OJF49_001157 [Ktedonobacterales bacterium]
MSTAVINDALREQIVIILRRHGVLHAGIFGSFARGAANDSSDIDLLIEFPPGKTLFDLEALALDLEGVVGRKVDLITYHALNPHLRERVLREQVALI